MWKLFIRVFDEKKGVLDLVSIPNRDVSHQTNDGHRGFTLMSAALAYINTPKFITYINGTFGEHAEITEVVIKFEDIV